MRPSAALLRHRDKILALLRRYPVSESLVFGSVAYGTDTESSDLDILVTVTASKHLQRTRITRELEEKLSLLLQTKVSVVDINVLRTEFLEEVHATAQPLAYFTPIDLQERFQRMNEKRLLFYFREMQQAAEKVKKLVAEAGSQEAVSHKRVYQDSLAKYIEEFGENCGKASNRFQRFAAQHSEFPWKGIQETHNKIAHEYGTLSPGMIWQIATQKLPQWQQQLDHLVKEIEQQLAQKNELEL